MTTETTPEDDFEILAEDPNVWELGDEVTVLVAGISVPWGLPGSGNFVCRRGDVLKVTRDTLLHQADFLALVADPAAQIERWGIQKLQRGRLDIERWAKRGDREWLDARNAARDLAHQIIDPTERAEALREVARKFGPGPATSTSTELRNVSQQRRLADDAAARAQQGRHVVQSLAE